MEPEENHTSVDMQSSSSSQAPAATFTEVVSDATSTTLRADPHIQGVFAALTVAVALSLLIRRVGRSTAAVELRRWLPLLYTVVWTVALGVVTWLYLRGLPGPWVLAVWLLFLVVVVVNVGWLRSVAAGVALSVEGRMAIGDSIRVGAVEGEVIGFGMRAVRLRAVDGTIHALPNDKLMTDAVANLTGEGGDSACEVLVPIPPGFGADRALDVAREVAILTPLASPRHTPEVFLLPRREDERRLDICIRGYAFDAAYQDHYRSDVISRMQNIFAADDSTALPKSAKDALVLEPD